ncbi:hypothetical protein G6M50_38095 [Agrobacterium rhizogenes]|nr:hypothetical protein [Rhizobium rhizogenes]NTJ83602.1 hypothetical protein [Rhizobium rhizogenes]
MGVVSALKSAVAEARSLGRDVPPVIEELLHLIAETIDPPTPDAAPVETAPAADPEPQPAPPVNNDHVAEGATQFTAEEIAASAPQPAPVEPAAAETMPEAPAPQQ